MAKDFHPHNFCTVLWRTTWWRSWIGGDRAQQSLVDLFPPAWGFLGRLHDNTVNDGIRRYGPVSCFRIGSAAAVCDPADFRQGTHGWGTGPQWAISRPAGTGCPPRTRLGTFHDMSLTDTEDVGHRSPLSRTVSLLFVFSDWSMNGCSVNKRAQFTRDTYTHPPPARAPESICISNTVVYRTYEYCRITYFYTIFIQYKIYL